MFKKYPELSNVPKEKIDNAWSVMRSYSPSLTHNPIAAGSFVKKIVEFEGIDPREIGELVNIEKGHVENSPLSQIKNLAFGAK